MADNVLFKSKEEAGFTLKTTVLKTTVLDNQIKYNIYEFSHNDCKKYFHLKEDIKSIGYITDKKFYVVNLYNTEFTEEFKSKFNFIDDEAINILLSTPKDNENRLIRKKIINTFNNIETFSFVKINRYNCHNTLDLTSAKNKLNDLNKKLTCNNYTLELNYIFDMVDSTEVNVFSFNGSSLLLCIYNKSKCVSSLVIKYNKEEKNIYIDSKTKHKFEGKKMNKLLRAVIILLSLYIYPTALGLVSDAINPISAYTMINHFKAVPFNEEEEDINNKVFNSFEEIEAYIKSKDGITTRVILNDENIENANVVFEKIIEDEFNCRLGGKKRISYRRRCHKKTRKSRKKTRKSKRRSRH